MQSKNIDLIIVDNIINFHNIPQIIMVLSTIYSSNIIVKMLDGVDLINIIQFTINSILDSNIIPLPNVELLIIKNLVDASINLLRINMRAIEIESKYCCF